MTHKIEWNVPLYICQYFGAVDFDEMVKCVNTFQGDSRFDDVRAAIWDFSSVTELDLTVDQCIRIAAQENAAAKTNPRIKIAVITSTNFAETMANLFEAEMRSYPGKAKIFHNMDEAMSWCS